MHPPSVDVSLLRYLQHTGVSIATKTVSAHHHTMASQGLRGGNVTFSTYCLASTAIWSPPPDLQPPVLMDFNHRDIPFFSDLSFHTATGCQCLVFYVLASPLLNSWMLHWLRSPCSFYLFHLSFPHSVWAIIEYLICAVLCFRHLRQSNDYVKQVPEFVKHALSWKGKCASNNTVTV